MSKLKKSFSMAAFASLLLAVFVPTASIATTSGCNDSDFAGGDGSSAAPYEITSVTEFDEIKDCFSSYKYFKIMNDLDFSGWGGQGIPNFTGVLEGNDKTLSNINITSSVSGEPFNFANSLFGKVQGSSSSNKAIIQNLNINGITFGPFTNPDFSTNLYQAGLIGIVGSNAILDSIRIKDFDQQSNAQFFGALAGSMKAQSTTTVEDIQVQGSLDCVSVTACAGLIGTFNVSGVVNVSEIIAELDVVNLDSTSVSADGGLIGRLEATSSTTAMINLVDIAVEFTDSTNGDEGHKLGGLVGEISASNNGTDFYVDFVTTSLQGTLPAADTGQGGLVGYLRDKTGLDISVNVDESVIGLQFGASANQGLVVGPTEDAPTVTISEVFHSTSLTSTPAGSTKFDSADRSTPATYTSFDITDNLSTFAFWYVQAADTRSELFGGYPVPYVLANSAAFGPRLFFRPNGGTGTAVGRVAPLPNALIDPIANPFTRTGFEFDSWNNTATGTGQTLAQSAGITGLDGGSIFARWNELYDTTFDANTADSGSVASIIDDNSITVPGKGNLVKNGFEFAGWNTLANGSGTPYSEGDTLNLIADTTLFAQWQVTQSTPAPYTGPLITSVGSGSAINASSTETIRVSGERLGSVSGVLVDGKEGTVVSVATDHFMMTLPEGLANGTYDLVVQSSIGNLTYLDAITVVGTAQEVEASEQGFGEVSAWTKRISDIQAKVYVKYPTVGEKVRISHQTGGSGDYETVYVKTTSSETMEGLRVVEGVGTYIVRTIDLVSINRIRVTVGNEELVQVRYN